MSKPDFHLSPIKENGKFVFIQHTIRVNGRLNKGDRIKLALVLFEPLNGGDYQIAGSPDFDLDLIVRSKNYRYHFPNKYQKGSELFQFAMETYLNLFYFGKEPLM